MLSQHNFSLPLLARVVVMPFYALVFLPRFKAIVP